MVLGGIWSGFYGVGAYELNVSVVSFVPVPWEGGVPSCDDADGILQQNVDGMIQLLIEAVGNGSKVVVFPEYSLQGPDLGTRDAALPFLTELPSMKGVCSEAVVNLSRAAVEYGVDVVVDVGEVVWCSGESLCPSDHRWQYNTQVALLANGSIGGVYRKSHLYFEPAFDPNPDPQPVVFESSTGVRIGMLICFDIMHAIPTLELATLVDVIAFSTWWPNKPPLLTGTQMQSGFTRAHNVSLLAAGVPFMGWHTSGSGIYTASNLPSQPPSVSSFQLDTSISHITALANLVSLPRQTPKKHPTSISPHTPTTPLAINLTTFLPQPHIPQYLSVSTSNISCTASITPTASSTIPYALVAASGSYNGLFPALFCAIIPCQSNTSTCFETDASISAPPLSISAAQITAKTLAPTPTTTWYPQGATTNFQALLDDAITYTPTMLRTSPQTQTITTLALVAI